jgi:hypothetical protein
MSQKLFVVPQNRSPVRVPAWEDLANLTGIINIRDYGAVSDGIINDLEALRNACAVLQSGQTLYIPNNTLIRLPSAVTTAQIGYLFDNLQDISIVGNIVNDEFGLDDTDVWHDIASMSAVGTTVTVTTVAPHGRGVGGIIQIYAECDNAYNGAVTIASVPDANTFTYVTLGAPYTGSTPLVNPATGVMKHARPDFDRYIFRFTRCQNVSIDLNFEGQTVPWASNHRLGYQLIDFRQSGGINNTIKDIKLFIRGGCSNGLSAGFYESSTIGHVSGGKVLINAKNCGYPVSGWSCAFEGTNFDVTGENVHRLIYLGGKKGGTIEGEVNNFTSSGVLVTTHYDRTNGIHYGINDIPCRVKDSGTTLGIPWMNDPAESVRFLVGINGSLGGGTPVYRNIVLECDLKVTDVIGRNIQAVRFFHSATEACILRDLIIKGSIDRSEVTDLNLFADDSNGECYVQAYPNQETHNIFFESFRVINSPAILAGTSPERLRFKRHVVCQNNLGRVYFLDSETTSPVAKLIVGGIEKDFDEVASSVVVEEGAATDGDIVLYSLAASPTVLRLALGGTFSYSIFSTAIAPQTADVVDLGSPSQYFKDTHSRIFTISNTGINIRGGAGAPTTTPTNGSLWLRSDGGVGTTIYARVAGAWIAIA